MGQLYSKEFIAALMAVVATLVVAYMALRGSEPAVGALIATSAASVSWFLRGRTTEPNA